MNRTYALALAMLLVLAPSLVAQAVNPLPVMPAGHSADVQPRAQAETTADAKAVQSTIESLQRIFAIILALAIGEAFKQFVSDKGDEPGDPHIHWDRAVFLLTFLFLVVPFFHGMTRYFHQQYMSQPLSPHYASRLLVDCCVFTLESILFFVLSRSLSIKLWQTFSRALVLLLLIDAGWSYYYTANNANNAYTVFWAIVNLGAAVLVILTRLFHDKQAHWYGAWATLTIIVVRTVLDYWLDWKFYFPGDG